MIESAAGAPAREPVPILGSGVSYLDGAEPELLALMRAASDRSSGSDELMHHIHDWPSNYHLSPLRENLLLPLTLTPGLRVLDVGCGTGTLTRRIAESGAEVIGLEGSLARAQVAAERVRGLDNARILCGSLTDYIESRPTDTPDAFDLILVCGVLEYAGAGIGGATGPARMLGQVRSLLAHGGSLVLAIENRWGLKYILSHPEDHLGSPWIGMEGYWRTASGIQTWSRRELAQLLSDAGLPDQRWFAAYPDYKMPKVLVAEELLSTREGCQLVKQFVRDPVSDQPDPGVLAADPLLTFQSVLDAGMGLELANSFLVVCGSPGVAERHVAPGLLWLGVAQRAKAWRSVRVLHLDQHAARLVTAGGTAQIENWPLVHSRGAAEVVRGVNAEDALRRALLHEGMEGATVRALIARWWSESMDALAESGSEGAAFDLLPSNFIIDDGDTWHLVDTEFRWLEELPEGFVPWRSALWTAVSLCKTMGVPRGVAPDTRVRDFVAGLLRMADVRIDHQQIECFIGIEAQIQARVAGDVSEKSLSGLADSVRKLTQSPVRSLRPKPHYLSLLADLDASEERLAQARQQHDELLAQRDDLLAQRDSLNQAKSALVRRVAELEATLSQVFDSTRWRAAERIRHPLSRTRGSNG